MATDGLAAPAPATQQSNTYAVTSIPQFLGLIEDWYQAASHGLWFRGVTRRKYAMTPSLLRKRNAWTSQHFVERERRMVTRFRERSIPFFGRMMDESVETMFVMQHHGIHTRLLDWTENPLIGLFFAFEDDSEKLENSEADDAVVWVLDPTEWNRFAIKYPTTPGPLTVNDDATRAHRLFQETSNESALLPIAVYGAHNTARIVAQRGVFLLFPTRYYDLKSALADPSLPANALRQLTISRAVVQDIRKMLMNHGITESTVYPDLAGLASEFRRMYTDIPDSA